MNTLVIGGTDFSAYVLKYGISAKQKPVYGSKITTLDGVDHNIIVRWKSVLTVSFIPMTVSEIRLLYEKLTDSAITVKYVLPHYGEVTQSMRCEDVSCECTFKNGTAEYYSGVKIEFTQN